MRERERQTDIRTQTDKHTDTHPHPRPRNTPLPQNLQLAAIEEMRARHEDQRPGNFLWMTVGLGKTYCVLSHLKYLQGKGCLPPYIVYTLPASAMRSVVEEICAFGLEVEVLVPLKSAVRSDHPLRRFIRQGPTVAPSPFVVSVIEHDHLRMCEAALLQCAPNAFVVVDEVHKALNATKRTSVALEMSRLSRDFVALTGTPVVDEKTHKLMWWFEQLVEFEVNDANFWTAANGMVAKRETTRIPINYDEVVAEWSKEEEAEYMRLAPVRLGGKNSSVNPRVFTELMTLSYRAATREMVNQVRHLLVHGGVFVVTHTVDHMDEVHRLLLQKGVVRARDVFCLDKTNSILLTDDAVAAGKTRDYKVVLTTVRKCEGYTLTRLKSMVTSVYPSNNATREQIEGRINRIGQKAKELHIRTVHCGILTFILQHHKDARSLSQVLQTLADEVALPQ